jgi:adenosine deaminase
MQKGNTKQFASAFKKAKEAGLGITLHIAEVPAIFSLTLFQFIIYFQVETLSSAAESTELLSFMPDRLGHATYLDDEAKKIVVHNNICIEICLSSNILCVSCFSCFVPLIKFLFQATRL